MQKIARLFFVILMASALASGQNTSQPSGRAGGSTPAPNTTVNPAPQSAIIQILTPVQGQASASNIVQLRYQLTNPAANAGSPNYRIQLDSADPVTTSDTEYTFTGLAPGKHSISVVLVDANGTPILGGRSAVQFSIKDPTATAPTNAPANPPRASITPQELGGTMSDETSMASSNSLPLLSLIGFGVLIGGVATGKRANK